MDTLSLTFLSSPATSDTKFTLFLKTHELQELTKVLERISTLPEEERKAWADEHGPLINQAIESLVQDSNRTLSQLSLDAETMQLSKDLVLTLRDTMEMMQGIIFESSTLRS